jgi:hypothetical protein
MSRKIRLAVLVFVFVNLVVSAAHALPPSVRQVDLRSDGVLAAAWEWFGALFSHASVQPRTQESRTKAGSSMDPGGKPENLLAGEGSDAGSQMDPDGYQ